MAEMMEEDMDLPAREDGNDSDQEGDGGGRALVDMDADEEEDVGEEEVASHTDLTLEEVASVKHRLRRA